MAMAIPFIRYYINNMRYFKYNLFNWNLVDYKETKNMRNYKYCFMMWNCLSQLKSGNYIGN